MCATWSESGAGIMRTARQAFAAGSYRRGQQSGSRAVAVTLPLLLLLLLLVLQLAVEAGAQPKSHSECASCVAAGYGWEPQRGKCGMFANRVCSSPGHSRPPILPLLVSENKKSRPHNSGKVSPSGTAAPIEGCEADSTPQPYAHIATAKLHEESVGIHGVNITFAVRSIDHVKLIHEHVAREIAHYALMKDAIEHSHATLPSATPLVMDIGSNHGMYSLFAATLGADVIAVEPQSILCDVVNKAAALNGPAVAGRITLYHNAVLDHRETITLNSADVAEGALASVVRKGAVGGGTEEVQTFPLDSFIRADDTRKIAFLKIDVEGYELQALRSAHGLFDAKRVDNLLIELGPEVRLAVAAKKPGEIWNKQTKQAALEQGAVDALAMLQSIHKRGMVPRLIDSHVWKEFMAHADGATVAYAAENKMVPLTTTTQQTAFFAARSRAAKARVFSDESYIWYIRDTYSHRLFPTFLATD